MKFFLSLFCILNFVVFSKAQNPVLEFDGVNDYVDLGPRVGSGVRTIEMWFKLENAITPQLNNFATLTAREISGTNGNTDEFSFSFQPYFVANPGTLRFDIDGTPPYKSVYSNNNSWNANQWYHVAAVVDPVEGMMLFINGIKQASTHPYTEATAKAEEITTIACWGNLYDRFFKGEIDAVRFSSEALYSSDFSPVCSDLSTQTNDIGLWNFNENIGSTAFDSSPNYNDGEIFGATWAISSICGNVVSFDGVNDYIDLGGKVGSGVRTVEMWFKLEEVINPQLNNFVTLTAREISSTNGNTDEFSFSFQPYFVANPGTLRFDVDGTPPYISVFSNNNTWNANQWYHAAAVIDPVEGMMLFIDGIKQTSTHPRTAATGHSERITTIGCWGDFYQRFFKGEIDDVRFSSEALYSADFSPICPDLKTQTNDIGLWNFNENIGMVVIDSSANFNDGQLVGAQRRNAQICAGASSNLVVAKDAEKSINDIPLKIYPNPSSDIFYFEYEQANVLGLRMIVFNSLGQIILNEAVKDSSFELRLQDHIQGMYYYQLTNGKLVVSTGKLIKK